jgi:hypothetical protein
MKQLRTSWVAIAFGGLVTVFAWPQSLDRSDREFCTD